MPSFMTSGTSLADGVSVQPRAGPSSFSGDCPLPLFCACCIAVNPFLVPHYIWLSSHPSVFAGVLFCAVHHSFSSSKVFVRTQFFTMKGETFLSKQVRKCGTPYDAGSVAWISVCHHVSQLLQSAQEIGPASVAWPVLRPLIIIVVLSLQYFSAFLSYYE